MAEDKTELARDPEGFKYLAESKPYDIDPTLTAPLLVKSSYRTSRDAELLVAVHTAMDAWASYDLYRVSVDPDPNKLANMKLVALFYTDTILTIGYSDE